MQQDKKNPANTINIELTEEVADGTYANFSIISHMPQEFVFDFVRIVPNVNKAKVKSRVIMSPQHAKRLMMALRENIKIYENTYGLIKDDTAPMPPVQFNTPKGEA
jgi:hypothetical protein